MCPSEVIPFIRPVQILKHAARRSTEQTSMRTKWYKHIAIEIVQAHLLEFRNRLEMHGKVPLNVPLGALSYNEPLSCFPDRDPKGSLSRFLPQSLLTVKS